jgi:hypothetical protein
MQDKKEKREINFIRISRSDAGDYLKQFHYLETVPGGNRSFLILSYGVELGVVCVSPILQEGINRVTEITRFVLFRNEKNLASMVLSRFIRVLFEEGVTNIVSYADPNVGHSGGIYKAAGAVYLGKGKDMVGFEVNGRVFSGRNLSFALLGKENDLKPIRLSGKHKYMFSRKNT